MENTIENKFLTLLNVVGLKIVALKGTNTRYDKKPITHILPEYIFFDDGETYIILEEQDPYSYHDYSGAARIIEVHRNKEKYNQYMNAAYLSNATYGNF